MRGGPLKRKRTDAAPGAGEPVHAAAGSDNDAYDREVEFDDAPHDDEHRGSDEDDQPKRPLALTPEELESFKKKQQKRGIIYVSRIPPGMTPAKVRHIFSQFGEVERMYLQPKDAPGKKRSMSHFTEGWIEFASKRVARTTADMLNAQPIGSLASAAHSSRRSHARGVANRWKDDVWTMKYLKGFRWPMLMEQMCTSLLTAHEKASHAARLRLELSQSAHEQNDYLRKVERARVHRKKDAKRAEAGEAPARVSTHTFQQRTPVFRDVRDQRARAATSTAPASAPPKSAAMEQVLDSIF